MKLVAHWRRIWSELPEGWDSARLTLIVPRAEQRPRAAALLGPAGPGRLGDDLRLSVHRAGGGVGPDQLGNLLGLLDAEGIRGSLALIETAARTTPEESLKTGAAETWARAVAELPPDWSDLYCQVELTSTDHLDRTALLLAPVNPARVPGERAFRFRVARTFGYGASPEMTERCFERLDADGIPGTPSILRVLSDTHNVDTQGPVWRVAGRAV
jgi:hypothetical protein